MIRQSFAYDNGKLIWIGKESPRRQRGNVVGTKGSHGYLSCFFNGKLWLIHRIIYALHHDSKSLQGMTVDHIDGNRLNNKIENLRIATYSENLSNKKLVRNTSGEKNVCWNKKTNKWRVRVNFQMNKYEIGSFENFDDAVMAARNARQKIHKQFARDC